MLVSVWAVSSIEQNLSTEKNKRTEEWLLLNPFIYSYQHVSILYRLEDLEAGAKDKSEFEKWQTEMKQKDLEAQLAAIEKRRLEGKLSQEEAILARQNLIKENRQRVAEIKEEVNITIFLWL